MRTDSHHSPETKMLMSAKRENYLKQHPEEKERMRQQLQKFRNDPKIQERKSISLSRTRKEQWKNANYRNKVISARANSPNGFRTRTKPGKPLHIANREEWKQRCREAVLNMSSETHTEWSRKLSKKRKEFIAKHPEEIERLRKLLAQANKNPIMLEEKRRKLSEHKKQQWKDPSYAKRMIKAKWTRPNQTELKLQAILDGLCPNEWKYVGNGEFFLGGKCPDFLNINGKKKLIELFGDYWHKGEDPQVKIDHYKQYGFDTLVLWEHELKDPERLKRKLVEP